MDLNQRRDSAVTNRGLILSDVMDVSEEYVARGLLGCCDILEGNVCPGRGIVINGPTRSYFVFYKGFETGIVYTDPSLQLYLFEE